MNTTNHLSQEEPQSSDEDFVAQLSVTVSKDGEFGFSCDWESGEIGTSAISSIFYGIAYDDLMEKILEQLKSQCVLEDNEEDFLSIVQSIRNYILYNDVKDGASGNDSDDSLTVSPRNVKL